MADVTLKIDAETAKAIREVAKFAQTQRTLEQGFTRQEQATTKANMGLGKMMGTVGALTGVGGIASLVGLTRKLSEHMKELANETNAFAKASVALSELQDDVSLAPQTRQLAAFQGAQHGVLPEQAVKIFQMAQSIFGSKEGAARGAQEAYQMMRLGATQEGAENVLKFGRAGGLTPEQSSTAAMVAARESALDITGVARSFTGLQGFRDPFEGAGALAALSGTVDAGELATLVRNTGLALDAPGNFTKRMSRTARRFGLDWDELSTEDRLRVIGQAMPDTSVAGFQKMGVEKRSARGLAGLMRNFQTYTRTTELARTSPLDLEDQRIAELRAQDPMHRNAWMAEEMKAELAYERTIGVDAQRAQEAQLRRQRVGLALQRSGLGWATNREGEPWGPIGWLTNLAGRAESSFTMGNMGMMRLQQSEREREFEASGYITDDAVRDKLSEMLEVNKEMAAHIANIDQSGPTVDRNAGVE